MDKWLIDEASNLINLNHVERIYVSDNFKINESYDDEKKTYEEVTSRAYDICVSTISGKIYFLGKTRIYYTEIRSEFAILEDLFKSIIGCSDKYIDFCSIEAEIRTKYQETLKLKSKEKL